MFTSSKKARLKEFEAQPWYEYQLTYEWDVPSATHRYNLYQYKLAGFFKDGTLDGNWDLLGSGDKAWARKNAEELDLKVPR